MDQGLGGAVGGRQPGYRRPGSAIPVLGAFLYIEGGAVGIQTFTAVVVGGAAGDGGRHSGSIVI